MDAIEWKVARPAEEEVQQYCHDFRLCQPIAQTLINRGIEPDQVEDFLFPRLRKLSDPYRFPDMEGAAARLWSAIRDGEEIAIHGDYDTDGITSTALLHWVLRECGAQVDCFLPHRIHDGYGLTEQSIEKAVQEQHKVLVTVDCGITSCDGARLARQKGIDVIITDHHEPGDETPDALAVINPKLSDKLQDLQVLAGVGVSFKLCHAFLKYGRQNGLGGHNLDLRDGMDLVALGTVADIVPLLGENRCLVKHGMEELCSQRRPGLRALCDIAQLHDRIVPQDIAFRLAPRLNAAGRVGDAANALRLLEAESIVDAYPLASSLDACNRKRQEFEEETYQQALEQIANLDIDSRYSILVQGRNWHRGVIGIVASRLTQTYNRPSIVMSIDEAGEVHGSGRSLKGIDLVSSLEQCRHLLVRYGGHPMATGLSLYEKDLPRFREAFEEAVRGCCTGLGDFRQTVEAESDARICELNDTFFEQLEMLEPFGHRHPAPAFRFHRLYAGRIMSAGRQSTRGVFVDGQGASINFIYYGTQPQALPPAPWDVVATPQLNYYRGEVTRQLQVQDLRSAR